jgi:AraC-like DNA-binding protein
MSKRRQPQAAGTESRPPKPHMNFGDAVADIVQRDRQAGIELWAVKDYGRLWAAYHETYVFCWACQQWTDQAWIYRRRRYAANPRTTMLIEPGETHRTLHGGPAEFYLLWVQPTAIQKMLDFRQQHFFEGQTTEAVVQSTFARTCQAITSGSDNPLTLEESTLDFLHTAFQICADSANAPRHTRCPHAVRRVREFLHEHYTENSIRLDDLAAVAGLSKYHLSRMFLREVGVPMHRYQTLVRLAKSHGLLLAGTSVCNAAHQLGFYDQSHFDHAFTQTYGMSPHFFACSAINRRR